MSSYISVANSIFLVPLLSMTASYVVTSSNAGGRRHLFSRCTYIELVSYLLEKETGAQKSQFNPFLSSLLASTLA